MFQLPVVAHKQAVVFYPNFYRQRLFGRDDVVLDGILKQNL